MFVSWKGKVSIKSPTTYPGISEILGTVTSDFSLYSREKPVSYAGQCTFQSAECHSDSAF